MRKIATLGVKIHMLHVMDNHIHVCSKVRKEQSLAKSASIDGQKYRTAADVVRCRHTKLTNQMLELAAGFPMHYWFGAKGWAVLYSP